MLSIQQEQQQCTKLLSLSPSLSLSLSRSGATRKLTAITKYLEDLRQTPEARDWILYRDCGPHKSVHQRGIYIAK